MKSELIDAIRTGDPEIMQIFKEPFDHKQKWQLYLKNNFGPEKPFTINKVLNLEERWHSHRFQALYVACWIYRHRENG